MDLLCRLTRAALWHHTPPLTGWASEPRCRLGGFNDRGHLGGRSCVLALSCCKRAGGSREVLCSCCHCRYSGAASGATGASCDLELMYFWCVVSCPVLTQVGCWCALTSSVGAAVIKACSLLQNLINTSHILSPHVQQSWQLPFLLLWEPHPCNTQTLSRSGDRPVALVET